MSKQAFKRLRKVVGIEVNREPLPAFAWPGGYPLFYLCHDGGVLCPDCVNANIDLISSKDRDSQWDVRSVLVNWVSDLTCDHCGKKIESAYGEVES